ncbi:MAG: YIP1 family protein [Planctomycetes bacterium]|nr:YIP1 family protein [Planctomycetota bacterium]
MLCPKCSRAISLDYGQDKCPHCGEMVGTDTVIKKVPEGLQPPSSGPSSPSVTITEDPEGPPTWDDEGPFFSRIWNTFVASMFHPGKFFSSTPTDAGIGKPLLYAIIVGSVGLIVSNLWIMMLIPMLPQPPEQSNMFLMSFSAISIFFQIILAPVQVVIYVFIYAAVLHVSLMIIKGNEQGFEATFRTAAYAMSTYLLYLVPFCLGIPFAIVWYIVIIIIGLRETHGISTGKAVVAWILPLIFCCGCGIAFFALTLIGSFGSAPPSYPY